MNKIYKLIFLFVLTFIILFNYKTSISFAKTNDKKIVLEIFKNDTCYTCYKEVKKIKEILKKYKKVEVIYQDINTNKEYFNKKMNELNVSLNDRTQIPIIIINNEKVIIKSSNYLDVLKQSIEKENFDIIQNKPNSISVLSIFTAGLIDGINPCSIAILIFFISSVIASNNIFKVSIPYILGTFLCYFLLGYGLLKITITIEKTRIFYQILYLSIIIVSLYLSYIYYKDYKYAKKYELSNVKSQLSSNKKRKIFTFIESKFNNRFVVLSSFLIGFIISIFEFSCSGQIYIPSILYMSTIKNINFFLLLALYNFAFIIPLITITFIIYKTENIILISQKLTDNLKWIKLLGCIFFIIIALVLILYFFTI